MYWGGGKTGCSTPDKCQVEGSLALPSVHSYSPGCCWLSLLPGQAAGPCSAGCCPRSLPSRAAPQPGSPSPVWMQGIPPSPGRTFHLPLFSFIRFLLACSSRQSASLQVAALLLGVWTRSSSLVLPANVASVPSLTSSKSLIKILSRPGSRTDLVVLCLLLSSWQAAAR